MGSISYVPKYKSRLNVAEMSNAWDKSYLDKSCHFGFNGCTF